ncbi:MAG: ATPase [Bacillota bacterium]
MDIFEILDDLEREIGAGKKLPLSNKVIVEKEVLLDYIDRLRSDLPEEMRQARWIVRERERVMKEAQTEAKEIIENARQKIKKLAEESEVAQEARMQAQEIVQEAHRIAYEIKSGANVYADDVLAAVEEKIQYTLATISNSRNELKSRINRKDFNESEKAI